MALRPVIVYEYVRKPGAGPDAYSSTYEKVFFGAGLFHHFGLDCETEEYGVGSFSTALVEMPDGSMKNVPVENIVFQDVPPAGELNVLS